ncbi:DUF1015 domain-containing protein [Algoriphagus sp.]|uniref:DUF1015 domain-containing protein n=1 Tax=Algoriphagus sp. TaxID=1872435 RepID=UPI0026386A5C|nr:DUF1015 domain-containing protein [Algoriphagus sp.]
MAEILPLRAWRYSDEFSERIEELTAPLFDVVSVQQREQLYKNPYNAIHLSVPKNPFAIQNAEKTVQDWKRKGVIKQDKLPGIYVYYQYFRLPGEEKERCRKGFIIQIKAYDWDEGKILRHENTIVSAVHDRVDLLAATKMQASPTHGLYVDEDFQLESDMEAAMSSPIYEVEDYQGVREVLAVIHDADVIRRFLSLLEKKQVILADGHHRLEGAIAYRKRMKGAFDDKKWKAHEYHLMYLTNAASDDLKILPTHRLYSELKMSKSEFFEKLSEWFLIKPFSDPEEMGTYTFRRVRKFGLLIENEGYIIELKPELFDQVNQGMPEVLRKLDLVILHEVLFWRILGIPLDEQRTKENLVYERNFSKCLREVQSGKASFAIITRELEMAQVLDVCNSGYLMPQKSTYFYPKALSGLIFASIDQDEFDFTYDAFFGKNKR